MKAFDEQKKSFEKLEETLKSCIKNTFSLSVLLGDQLFSLRREKALIEETINQESVSSEEITNLQLKLNEIEQQLDKSCKEYAGISVKYLTLCRAKEELFGFSPAWR